MVQRRSILEIMREGDYDPMAGRPIPIERIYESNVISYDEYKQELERQRMVRLAGQNAAAIDEMEASANTLNDRAIRAGVPKRFLQYAIDLRNIEDLRAGKGVYLFGSQGTYKTTLACSMLRGWLHDNLYGVAKFVRSTTLMDEFRATFNNHGTASEVMGKYASAGLLLIDDLGKEVASQWAVSKLWELFDRRYGDMKPTIVTSQHRPDELAGHLSENGTTESALAIVSRIREQYLVFDMGTTDHR